MRFERMSGLDAEQLDELEQRVGELLKKPWDQGTGRPKELTLREALIVTSGYMRNNIRLLAVSSGFGWFGPGVAG